MVYQSKWKPEDKIRIMMESVNTLISTSEFCKKHGVVPNTFYDWKEKFLEGEKVPLLEGSRTMEVRARVSSLRTQQLKSSAS